MKVDRVRFALLIGALADASGHALAVAGYSHTDVAAFADRSIVIFRERMKKHGFPFNITQEDALKVTEDLLQQLLTAISTPKGPPYDATA